MTRLLIAAALLAACALAQGVSYARTPAPEAMTDQAWAATTTNCEQLRDTVRVNYNVWRAGVKVGNEPAGNLAVMRAVLVRLGALERQGVCGG